jgi:MFS family permease
MGTVSDWIGRRNALAICTLIEGAALLWLLTMSSIWSLFVFGVVFGFFYGGHAPQLPALVGETLGFENLGALLGTANMFWGLGSAIGPFMTGYLFDITGSYTAGFTLAMVSILAASANGFFLLRTARRVPA